MPARSADRRTASGGKRPPGSKGKAAATGQPDGRNGQAGAHLDGVTMPTVPMPRMHLPEGTTGNVLWWGGLAAVAALGVVDWPVAALVAAGTWVAEKHARQSADRPKAAS